MQDVVVTLLATVLMLGWLPLAVCVLYLLLLAAAALVPSRKVPAAESMRHFRIVIPAHNEALVLEPVLRRLTNVTYPRNHFEIVVVADNCTDNTAEVARRCGVRVIERRDHVNRGKGQALAYAFRALRGEAFDAYVILDADTFAAPALLTVFNRYLEAGQRTIQAHYDVLNPFENGRTTLMYVAFQIFNYVRPLGRRNLGLSTGLKGNGMCFAKSVIDNYPWTAFSLAEDIEYTTTLLLNGEEIIFAPEARVSAQMPVLRGQATSQRVRWEGGRLQLARRDGPCLVWHGLRRFNMRVFDWGMDLVIPPLAALTLMICVGTIVASAAALVYDTRWSAGLVWAWLGLLAALIGFVVAAMLAGRLPKQAYIALFHAPGYVLWKIWIYGLMFARRIPQQWVRTERTRIQDS